MSIYPWNQVGTGSNQFVLTFQNLGISVATGLLNFVVLTAAFSAINSDVFGVRRMLQNMAGQEHTPRIFRRVSRHCISWITVQAMILMNDLLVGHVLLPYGVFLLFIVGLIG